MKKIIALFSFVIIAACSFAQGFGGDPATMKERTKERIKAPLIEQTKITDAQADKVIDIYFDAQLESMKLRRDDSMDGDAKKAKMKEINDARDKKVKEIPLTDDQANAVKAFYDEQRKKMQERGGQKGGGRD